MSNDANSKVEEQQAATALWQKMSMSERADEYERQKMIELNGQIATKSALFYLAEGRRYVDFPRGRMLMGTDPRLEPMPEKPTLKDFFKYRFTTESQHLLQSANLAQKNGLSEKVVLACLLHDIAVVGLIRSDHGYWGAQMIAPYVDEEISWAIHFHQALRFYADESVGYEYPDNYRVMFGEDFVPDPYIQADYEYARNHKWYMTSRLVCLNDLYSFDPNVIIEFEQFEDIIGRHFKQPEEGLGNDRSPTAHMWRTMIRPCNAL